MGVFYRWGVLVCEVLVVVSLISSAPVRIKDRQQRKQQRNTNTGCNSDEFFDTVVGLCQRCVDVCKLTHDVSCIKYCQGYVRPTDKPDVAESGRTVVSAGETNPSEQSLIHNPLVWVSAVSLLIAIVATIAIVVVLTNRRKTDQTPGNTPLLTDVDRTSTRTSSESSGGEPITSGKPICTLLTARENNAQPSTSQYNDSLLTALNVATDDGKLNIQQQTVATKHV